MQSFTFLQFKIPRLHFIILIMACLPIIAIAWPFHFFFLNDDLIHIPLAASGKIGHRNSIRYIGDYSLMIDHFLFGKSAAGYHLTNLMLHLINVFLLWKILFTFFLQRKENSQIWFVLYSVLLFAYYGFHNDAIFWIIGRSASLGCLFLLLTIYCLQHADENILFKLGAGTFWFTALFSYESVWIFPIILSLGYFIFGKAQMIKKSWLYYFWISFGAYLIIRKFATSEWLGTYEASSFQSFNLGPLILNYLKLIARTIIPPIQDHKVFILFSLIGMALLSIPIIILLVRKSYDKNLMFILACWLISYLPYLSLGISTKSIESERFLYLPSLFFSVGLIYTLFILFKDQIKLFQIISVSIIAFNALNLMYAAEIFKNNGKLVEETYSLLSENEPIHILEVKNLPQTIHGIPVFRSGFREGYDWLVTPVNLTNALILDSLMNSSKKMEPLIITTEEKTILKFKSINP
jgi:hypothetical protein